jgi:inorganic phosphate transporter, PiT family
LAITPQSNAVRIFKREVLMSEIALQLARRATVKPNLDQKPHGGATLVFVLLLVCGIGYAAYGIFTDTNNAGEPLAIGAFVLLGIALMIALVPGITIG